MFYDYECLYGLFYNSAKMDETQEDYFSTKAIMYKTV